MDRNTLRRDYEQTLLGRLRLALFKNINELESIPDAKEQLHFLLTQFRTNSAVGKIFQGLLMLRETHHVESKEIELTDDISSLLERLERHPLARQHFVEFYGDDLASNPTGILVTRFELRPSGYVYEITIFCDEHLVERVRRIEVRACLEEPRPPFSVLTDDGYEHAGIEEVATDSHLRIAVMALQHLCERSGIRELGTDEVVVPPALKPPMDKILLELVEDVCRGKRLCATADIPLSMVKPYSAEFCLSYSLSIVKKLANHFSDRPGKRTPLIVYWGGESFVMSDDYGQYLAYRRLQAEKVPVVIVGGVPDFVNPNRVGGAELFPPFQLVSVPVREQPTEDKDVDLLIDEYVCDSSGGLSDALSQLYALYFVMAEMVDDPNTREAELHSFLATYPVLVDPTGFALHSEVRLGSDYRIDLVLQFQDAERQILLIELERADIKLFTRKGRPRAPITHATQQVEDWLRWWREHPKELPLGLDHSIVPKGVVVVGRSKSMDQDAQRRLAHLNANRDVTVLTYDDLLTRIEGFIRQLERLER